MNYGVTQRGDSADLVNMSSKSSLVLAQRPALAPELPPMKPRVRFGELKVPY